MGSRVKTLKQEQGDMYLKCSIRLRLSCNACGDLKMSENFNVWHVCKLSGLFCWSSAKYQESQKTKWRVNSDLMQQIVMIVN